MIAILRAKAALWLLLNDRTGNAVPALKFDSSLRMPSEMIATRFYVVLYRRSKLQSTRCGAALQVPKHYPHWHFALFTTKL